MANKGQEEIVGFVLIVIICAVVFVILLGFMLRQDDSTVGTKAVDIGNFLQSLGYTTTSCAIRIEGKQSSVSEMILECYKNPENRCKPDSENVCSALNNTLKKIMGESWKIGPEYPYKGYELNMLYASRNNGTEEEWLSLNEGNCTGDYIENEHLLPETQSRGTIEIQLRICN